MGDGNTKEEAVSHLHKIVGRTDSARDYAGKIADKVNTLSRSIVGSPDAPVREEEPEAKRADVLQMSHVEAMEYILTDLNNTLEFIEMKVTELL